MGRVLVALNEEASFTADLLSVAKQLFENWKENLYVGLIAKDFCYTASISSYVHEAAYVDNDPHEEELLSEEDQKKAEVLSNFVKRAKCSEVKYEIHNDFKMNTHEVITQTTFADLLILSYDVFFDKYSQRPDNTLLFQILRGSKCPVLIIPKNIDHIDNLIFTYDGKESSVFAIRAFSNLFAASTKDKVTSVLTIMPSLEEEIKNEKHLLNLVKHYYQNVGTQLLEGNTISQEIINFADSVENPLLVMGAYGRSSISNLLLPSVAKRIIQKQRFPIFIAHR